MKRFRYIFLLALLCASTQSLFAQDNDLNIFGYFQSTFTHVTPVDSTSSKYNTFAVQQLNIFLSKPLGNDFSAFVNLEINNSFSSSKNWGSMSLEEAWMKYYGSDAFNVKAGLLIPQFNNLNEIKNKTPLLPYIYRPIVYEASVSELINLEDWLPERAFVQVYGFFPLGDVKLDYAAYAGNSYVNYMTSQTKSLFLRGTDTTTYKMIGGRIGARVENLKVGVSGTYDRENHNDAMKFGDLPRTRIGADLSYSRWGFTLEGELIMVKVALTDDQKTKLENINKVAPASGTSFDKNFYYGALTYNITSQIYAFGLYSYIDNKTNGYFQDGLITYSLGAGYRPIDAVAIKAQYTRFKFNENKFFWFEINEFQAGASVVF